jgi:hypothetical protein
MRKSRRIPTNQQKLPSISHKKLKQSKRITNQESPNVKKGMSFLGKVLVWVATFITIFLGILYYSPKVSISPTSLIVKDDPFFIPFIVKNDSNTKIDSFIYSSIISWVLYEDGSEVFDTKLSSSNTWKLKTIKKGGTNPINIFPPVRGKKPQTADIFIKYKYFIPIFNISFNDSIRFRLIKDNLNTYHWVEFQFQ